MPTAICQPDCSPPDLLFRLFVWIENPGASALFRWLLPRLYELYGIDLHNVTHVARLTHCFGGGAAWRKYTQILSSDQTLSNRIGVCGPCPALNCGHAKQHEITFAGNTSLPALMPSTSSTPSRRGSTMPRWHRSLSPFRGPSNTSTS